MLSKIEMPQVNRPQLMKIVDYGFGFRPDIEGLRAIAVSLVVLYHANVPYFQGGFVGVDVFFVISGFLITGLLLQEATRTGRVALRDFYARRARRLLPASCLVAAVTGVVGFALLPQVSAYQALFDLGSAVLYVSNWRFIGLQNNYLAETTSKSPALHYWSLSVEEQFYVVWPILIVLLIQLGVLLGIRLRRLLMLGLGTVTASSFILALYVTANQPNVAYLSTPTRAWQFGTGALTFLICDAFHARIVSAKGRRLRQLLSLLGLGILVVAGMTFNSRTSYPGTAAILPTLGTAAVLLGCTAADDSIFVARLLGSRPFRSIGKLSYTWYLWHWPVVVFIIARDHQASSLTLSAGLTAALGCAWLTHRFVERPLMSDIRIRSSRIASALSGAIATVAAASILAAAGAVAAQQGEGRGDATALDPAIVWGPVTQSSGRTVLSPYDAQSDVGESFDCMVYLVREAKAGCDFGPVDGRRVVLFGDSHAQQWAPALRVIAERQGWRLSIITSGGCPWETLRPRPGLTGHALDRSCVDWREDQMRRIVQMRPSVIFLGSYMRALSDEDYARGAWKESIDVLAGAHAKILYLRDTPYPGENIPLCVGLHENDWSACDFPDTPKSNLLESRIAASFHDRLAVVDATAPLRNGKTNFAVKNGIILYRDEGHLSATAAALLVPTIESAMRRLGV